MAELIGHEGENSLLSFLKSENLANALSTGNDMERWADCLTIFLVEITLTKNALDKIDRVAEITYKYLSNIRDHGPDEQFFDELNAVGRMNFKFADKENSMNTVTKYAERMP